MASVQHLALFAALFLQFLSGVYSSTCSHPIGPGILSGAGTTELPTTGFLLQPVESTPFSVPTSSSGRLWGRALCTQDSSGQFSCLTGDFGCSTVACSCGGAAPPATLTEFTLNGAGAIDFYDVDLVNVYNLPMMVTPQGGTGLAAFLNDDFCQVELKIIDGSIEGVACKSACDAFVEGQYCCSGACESPDTCKPSTYSEFFNNACPQAYSFAYDDGTSTFTCAGANYISTFCPSLSSRLNLIANVARPNPQGSFHNGTIPIVRFRPALENTAAETKPCITAPTSGASHVHVLPRNHRRLRGKLPNVNVHSPPSASNKTSWNLDKEDPPSPPAPTSNRRIHQ